MSCWRRFDVYDGQMPVDWNHAQKKAARTGRWAVTMAKVRIRRVLSRTHWQLISICGPSGGESVGVVDMVAMRKDHRKPANGLRRGDLLQIILIQVKGGTAAMPTEDDAIRLRGVARQHRARAVLLASWKKGKAARFFRLRRSGVKGTQWAELHDLDTVFH